MGFKNIIQNIIVGGGGDTVERDSYQVNIRRALKKVLTTEFLSLRTLEKARYRTTDALVVIAKTFDTTKFVESPLIRATATTLETLARTVERNFLGLRTFEKQLTTLAHFVGLRVFEQNRTRESSFVRATASVTETIDFRTSQAIAPRVFDKSAKRLTDQFFFVSSDNFANQAITTTGITNPANGLGDNTNTAATSTASSSGLAGTTSNTTNFNYVVDFQDVNIAALTPDITSVVLNIEHGAAQAGVAVGAESAYTLRYGFNGSTNVDLTTAANAAKRIQTFDITGAVGDNFTLLNTIRVQLQGSTTSGVGLGAANTVSIYRVWVTFSAQGTNAN